MPAVPFRSAAAVLSARGPLGFEQRRLLLAQHGMRRYETNEWSEAFAVVERGVLGVHPNAVQQVTYPRPPAGTAKAGDRWMACRQIPASGR
jgi:hypothetical protein